jgi:hypothetical protein
MSAPHLETPAIEGNPHSLSCIPTEPAADVFASQPLIVRFREVGKSFRRFDYQPFLLRNVLLRLTGRAHKPREFWPCAMSALTFGEAKPWAWSGRTARARARCCD